MINKKTRLLKDLDPMGLVDALDGVVFEHLLLPPFINHPKHNKSHEHSEDKEIGGLRARFQTSPIPRRDRRGGTQRVLPMVDGFVNMEVVHFLGFREMG